MFITLATIGNVMHRSRFTPSRIQSALTQDLLDKLGHPLNATPTEKILSLIRIGMLIRTALFEGSAFFGLNVLIIAAADGVLLATPWLWLNGIPAIALFAFVIFTFPTAARLQHIFETTIQRSH